MRPPDLVRGLTRFERRGVGSNAERRAAAWISQELETGGREATVETFWCRPNWALAHAWHALLALAGSLVSVSHAEIGGALVLVALISVIADSLTGHSLGRRLTPEHASQNVVSHGQGKDPRVRLIVTSNYDAGHQGIVYRDLPRRAAARWRQIADGGRFTPGWMGWLAIQLVWLIGAALLRRGGITGTWVGIAQLIPTVALVLEFALLLELGGSDYGPAAGDNASGTAVALAVVRALDAAPPRRLRVELVLQGAGDGQMIGLRRHLRARRRELSAANTVVLGIAPCGAGRPHWWSADGSLLPVRYLGRLRQLVAGVAGPGSDLDARPYRGRGVTPALPARAAGLPAITIGALDALGVAPRSHQAGDLAQELDPGAMDTVLELALTLVDAIDAELARAGATTGRSGAARASA